MKNKIKIFTHTDLDGVGCIIVLKYFYRNILGQPNKEINYSACNYDDINERIKKFIDECKYNEYDKIYITDISINHEVANLINTINNVLKFNKFILIDHHKTIEEFNDKYNWCTVDTKYCATKILYDYLLNNEEKDYINMDRLYDFVELVNSYDTWLWKDNNDIDAYNLNILFSIYRFDKFINLFINKLSSNAPLFSKSDKIIIELKNNEIESYINKKVDSLNFIISKNGLKLAIVYCDKYISEIADRILDLTSTIDIVCLVDISINNISLRTRRDHILVDRLCKHHGGGGHPKAAGFKAKELKEELNDIISELL